MTGRKTLWRLSLVLALALVSTSYGAVVGNFEGNLDGWYKDTATLSLSTTAQPSAPRRCRWTMPADGN